MFKSVLVANRGEIARRVFRTARRMGIRTVAVYSEADADAPFVREADAAVFIGASPARESYLVAEKILAAARQSGAEAVHPGYGFLSETAEFAEAVKAAGLVWIGPPASAIRSMGLKDAAKALMQHAGVKTTPGYLGADQSDKNLLHEAEKIGFPVLIKAVAGGGGKGMRKVDGAPEFLEALASCRREAKSSFGDERVLLEMYVAKPRHLEVQVFGDSHGEVVHLFERDCSLQRRHQKVIEEAPAPGMTQEVRESITRAAVTAAKAVKYEGAGTIEFIADASEGLRADRVWFMEMNTRLQVEHPVTEAVTGIDLVEWQFLVAAGGKMPLRQDEISLNGHSIEARLYAENPETGFLPSTGRLAHLRLPRARVRVDSAVEEGSEVSGFYDPMIAKLIAHEASRDAAARVLASACAGAEVWPVKTNAAFLARTLGEAGFLEGHVDTGFLARHGQRLVGDGGPSERMLEAAAVSRISGRGARDGLLGFRLNAAPKITVRLQAGDEAIAVSLSVPLPEVGLSIIADGDGVVVFESGRAQRFMDAVAEAGGHHAAADGEVLSPMPGTVLAVSVSVGDAVKKGAALVVMEAMKMEISLTAPFDGVVKAVAVKTGERVAEGVTVVRVEAG
jgi:3-methylcrotonyl-CoA carboxylase alpha subunit